MHLALSFEGREKGDGNPVLSKAINHQRYPEKPPQGLCSDESMTTVDDNSQGKGSVQLPGAHGVNVDFDKQKVHILCKIIEVIICI
ncbi:hypothetical protein H671_2g6259 [Cricetulus griseus]|uniref:Uncharacterized protein n=1 Tax=Cricetulus griseus TaxID=10029 RepID=A0A061IEM5_CRIGR|nr:hypothetical protein H671_2g6259 [Cricetulus griseus]